MFWELHVLFLSFYLKEEERSRAVFTSLRFAIFVITFLFLVLLFFKKNRSENRDSMAARHGFSRLPLSF